MPSVNLYPIVSEDMGPSGKYDESLQVLKYYSHALRSPKNRSIINV